MRKRILITAVFLFFIAAGSLFSFSSGSCCIAFHSTLEERQKDIVRLILDSLSGYEYEIKLPFSISPDEAETIVDHVLTDYPELFYVGDEYYYTQTGESAPVSAITFTPRMPRRQAERIWKQMMLLRGAVRCLQWWVRILLFAVARIIIYTVVILF